MRWHGNVDRPFCNDRVTMIWLALIEVGVAVATPTSAFDLSHLNRLMKLWQWITFDGFLLSGGLTQRCQYSIFQLLFVKMLFILTSQFNTTVGRFYGNCHKTIGFNDVIDWQRCHSNVFKWSLLFLKMLFILTCQFNTAVGRFNGECYADYCSFIM